MVDSCQGSAGGLLRVAGEDARGGKDGGATIRIYIPLLAM
jgi:hypothetical protein